MSVAVHEEAAKSEFLYLYFALAHWLLNRGAFSKSSLLSIVSFLSKEVNISSVANKGRTNSSPGFTHVNPGHLFFFFVGFSRQR